MPQVYLRKYGVQATVDFELYETDGTDLKTDAVSASGDVTIYRDEAAEETLDADAFTDEGKIYSLVLSATEMQAARIVVCVVDQGTKAWLDKVFYVETYGNASAMHAFDLDTATVNLSAATETQIDNIETDTNEIQGKLPTNKIMGSSDVDNHDTDIDAILVDTAALDGRLTDVRAGYLDELAAANLPTDVANVKVDTAAILVDTGTTLQGDITTIKKYLGNKWAIVGNQLIFYDDDKVTPIRTFTLDSATAPTTRTPV